MLMADANDVIDYMKSVFGMEAEHAVAIQAVHAGVHQADIGTKYTWFGPGYISSQYYKMIANKPTYKFDNGGDLSFSDQYLPTAVGDPDGKPVPNTGW